MVQLDKSQNNELRNVNNSLLSSGGCGILLNSVPFNTFQSKLIKYNIKFIPFITFAFFDAFHFKDSHEVTYIGIRNQLEVVFNECINAR